MIKTINIESFRSIKNSGEIRIKPITVLVGKNSVGKSSVLRLLPLLKQTLEKKTSDPILWYGDLVDFGDFNNVTYFKSGRPIIFQFSFDIPIMNSKIIKNKHLVNNRQIQDITITLKIELQKHLFKSVSIHFFDQQISFSNNKGVIKLKINESDDISKDLSLRLHKENYGLIPKLFVHTNYHENTTNNTREFDAPISQFFMINNQEVLQKEFSKLYIGSLINSYTSIYSKEDFSNIIKTLNFPNGDANYNDSQIDKLNDLFLLLNLDSFISTINHRLSIEFDNTNYIKPVRATAERYYRIQGVDVREMTSDGSNIPMILFNMSEKEKAEFKEWSLERFGVSFKAIPTGGHISIIVNNNFYNKKNTNLADTGFGFSQMLPIIISLWMIEKKRLNRYTGSYSILIEQPELHLHPALQAELIRAFVSVVNECRKLNINVDIIFETHSEVMVNELGRLVAQKTIDTEDVNILTFEKKEKDTVIKSCSFDQDGLLINWPIGFFSSRGR